MDRIFRLPRVWSNSELKKFAPLFTGRVVNVSAWRDEDKEGAYYRDYFSNAESYFITNFKSEARGFQGIENEIFLDLTEKLDESLQYRFEVVFNHTVLEHVYEIKQAFENLCLMSSDVVILVVPFLQRMHADYGDYWRFTPLSLRNMFGENDFNLQYCSFNSHSFASTYIFCIGIRKGSRFSQSIPFKFTYEDSDRLLRVGNYVGVHAIPPLSLRSLIYYTRLTFNHFIMRIMGR